MGLIGLSQPPQNLHLQFYCVLLFLLWLRLSLWRCFALLPEEILFPFLCYVQVFCVRFVCLSLEMPINLFLFPFLLSGYFSLIDACVVCIVSVFLLTCSCSLLVIVSMHQRYHKCRQDPFLFLFLVYKVLLRLLCDIRSYAPSWIFLFFCPYVEYLLWSSLRMDRVSYEGNSPEIEPFGEISTM